jgi:lipoprotein NlpI
MGCINVSIKKKKKKSLHLERGILFYCMMGAESLPINDHKQKLSPASTNM